MHIVKGLKLPRMLFCAYATSVTKIKFLEGRVPCFPNFLPRIFFKLSSKAANGSQATFSRCAYRVGAHHRKHVGARGSGPGHARLSSGTDDLFVYNCL